MNNKYISSILFFFISMQGFSQMTIKGDEHCETKACKDFKKEVIEFQSLIDCQNLLGAERLYVNLQINNKECILCLNYGVSSESELRNILLKKIKVLNENIIKQKIEETKFKIAAANYMEAEKLLNECKPCTSSDEYNFLKQLIVNKQENQKETLLGLSYVSSLKKLDNKVFYNDGKIVSLKTFKPESNNFSLNNKENSPQYKVSPLGSLMGESTSKSLSVDSIGAKSLMLNTQISVPYFTFDERDSCVYYTNRNSAEDLFCVCRGAKPVVYKFPQEYINAKWRVDAIYPEGKFLVLRMVEGKGSVFKLLSYEPGNTKKGEDEKNIRLNEINSKELNKVYSEFKIIYVIKGSDKWGDSRSIVWFSAFESRTQTYDIFKFDFATLKLELNTEDLNSISNFKVVNNVLFYFKNTVLSTYNLSNAAREKISDKIEPNFDSNQNSIIYWEKKNPDINEWELKIFSKGDSQSLKYNYVSLGNNPPVIFAFEQNVICYDYTSRKYHLIDINRNNK